MLISYSSYFQMQKTFHLYLLELCFGIAAVNFFGYTPIDNLFDWCEIEEKLTSLVLVLRI